VARKFYDATDALLDFSSGDDSVAR